MPKENPDESDLLVICGNCKHRNPFDQPMILQLPKTKATIIGAKEKPLSVMPMMCCGNTESDKYGSFLNPAVAKCEMFEKDDLR